MRNSGEKRALNSITLSVDRIIGVIFVESVQKLGWFDFSFSWFEKIKNKQEKENQTEKMLYIQDWK